MRFGDGLLEEIRRRTDLVQLVGRKVKLARKGNVFWGLCPFHKEKSGSFKVENERRNYHCFGCGAGGDCFKWLQEIEGLTFPESVQKLAAEASVELPAWSPEDEARESRRKSLYDIVQLAAEFFERQLHGANGAAARAYLKSRGLNTDICRRFGIGYAPDSNSALREYLAAKNVDFGDMIEAGLVRAGDEGRGARDFFFDRIMFPILDVRGRVIAFGGRGLSADAKPKYINTGETALFSKGHLLYNLRNAREAVKAGATLIVAEGYMDVIALSEAGFTAAVAPLGTALTEDQLQLLWKVAPEPILCLDGDEAGIRAARRAARVALPLLEPGQSLRFVFLPGGEDPDSFLKTNGTEPMRALLAKARGLVDVLWTSETEGKDLSTPERRAGLEAALEALARDIKNPTIADYYRRDFKERVFAAFKQRRPQSAGRQSGFGRGFSQMGQGQRGGQGKGNGQGARAGFSARGRGYGADASQEGVSPAVRRSLHAVNAAGAARRIKERELMGHVVAAPALIDKYAELLAALALADPQLDRLKGELLHLAASGVRLERNVVENHLVRQGMGVLADGLKAQATVQGVVQGGVEGVVRGSEDALHEAAMRRAFSQLEDPELATQDDLVVRRVEANRRYLSSQAAEDFEELQRLNDLINSVNSGNINGGNS